MASIANKALSAQPDNLNEAVYVSLASLLHCRLLARQLKLSQQRKILSQQSGLHASRFRGRGVDFSEVRAYQPGDDIRSIDWRVTARTGQTHTKLYAEERERPALVIVDQSASMFFGSQLAFKSVTAARVAALLAWATLNRGDRSGGIIFSDSQLSDVKPRRSHHAVLQLLQGLLDYNHSLNRQAVDKQAVDQQAINNTAPGTLEPPGITLADSLQHARRTTKPGSELFIISDFQDFDSTTQRQLFQLARHNDLVCIMIYDPLEARPPAPGLYTISNGQQRRQINLADNSLRQQYQQGFTDHSNNIQGQLDQLKIPLLRLSTDQDPLTALQLGLGIRPSRGR